MHSLIEKMQVTFVKDTSESNYCYKLLQVTIFIFHSNLMNNVKNNLSLSPLCLHLVNEEAFYRLPGPTPLNSS